MTPKERNKLVRRLQKAARNNEALNVQMTVNGRTRAAAYAQGSAFAFRHAARIVKGEVK